MIIALSAEQLQEMANNFEAAYASGNFEAPWWISNETAFPKQETATDTKDSNETNPNQKTAEDTKPSAKTSPEDTVKRSGCPRRSGNCRAYGCDPNAMFQHCLRMKEAARRQREEKQARIIEQKTPIHMHQETDDAARMSLDLTGFSEENISIHVENYIVSIVANRTNKLGDVFVVDRRFRLDKKTANPDQVTATFEDGILELTVPKKSVVGPRKIPIVVSSSVASNNNESVENDDDTSKASNTFVVDDEAVQNTEATDKDTSPPAAAPEQAQEEISVETVDGQNETLEETKNAVSMSETEDETWEEVAN